VEEYDIASEAYGNSIFYMFVVAGLILAVAGLFITNLSFQIVGLGAGVGLIIEGIARNLNNRIMAFVAALLVFIILSYFVWRKVKD
jgi:multisubunit Na+/H+ antiporter MnhE subunit